MKRFSSSRLKNLRKSKGYSLERMARLLGLINRRSITRSAISHWETGKASPSLDSLIAVSELFGTPIDYFFVDDPNCLFTETTRRGAKVPESADASVPESI